MTSTHRPGSGRRRLTGAVTALMLLTLAGCGGDGEAAEPEPTLIKSGTLTVCTDIPYKPFAFRKGGETVGFDVDIAQAVADEMGVKLDVVDVDFDDIVTADVFLDKTCDLAAAGMTITVERSQELDFSSRYLEASQALVALEGESASSLAEMAPTVVGVQDGSTGEQYLEDNPVEGVEVLTFAAVDGLRTAIDSGEIDAAMVDNTAVGALSRGGDLVVVEEFETGEQYGMAVQRDANTDLLRVTNNVIASMKSEGSLDELIQRWFAS